MPKLKPTHLTLEPNAENTDGVAPTAYFKAPFTQEQAKAWALEQEAGTLEYLFEVDNPEVRQTACAFPGYVRFQFH